MDAQPSNVAKRLQCQDLVASRVLSKRRAVEPPTGGRRPRSCVLGLNRLTDCSLNAGPRQPVSSERQRLNQLRPDLEIVRQRYRHIARVYPILELLWLPPGIRREAVDSLTLRPGEHVVELGCGTGRNLLMLSEAVGSGGRVIGVDLSPAMLDRARRRARGLRLQNVSLYLADAATFRSPEPVDAVLFSLSYSVMPNRVEALRLAWERLRSGGRLVVMDGKIPNGLIGKVSRSLITWLSQRTVLGDPNSRPWKSLGDLGADVDIRDRLAGFYFICRSVKRTGQFHIDAALKS